MRSPVIDALPPRVRRSLAKLGKDLKDARRKRSLTVEMMLERVGVSKVTYLKVEKGGPSVSMGVYAMTLFTLGFAAGLADIADSRNDNTGMLMDSSRLPQRAAQESQIAMRRVLDVFLGETARQVGTLRFEAQGARQSAGFEYHPDWLAAVDRYALVQRNSSTKSRSRSRVSRPSITKTSRS